MITANNYVTYQQLTKEQLDRLCDIVTEGLDLLKPPRLDDIDAVFRLVGDDGVTIMYKSIDGSIHQDLRQLLLPIRTKLTYFVDIGDRFDQYMKLSELESVSIVGSTLVKLINVNESRHTYPLTDDPMHRAVDRRDNGYYNTISPKRHSSLLECIEAMDPELKERIRLKFVATDYAIDLFRVEQVRDLIRKRISVPDPILVECYLYMFLGGEHVESVRITDERMEQLYRDLDDSMPNRDPNAFYAQVLAIEDRTTGKTHNNPIVRIDKGVRSFIVDGAPRTTDVNISRLALTSEPQQEETVYLPPCTNSTHEEIANEFLVVWNFYFSTRIGRKDVQAKSPERLEVIRNFHHPYGLLTRTEATTESGLYTMFRSNRNTFYYLITTLESMGVYIERSVAVMENLKYLADQLHRVVSKKEHLATVVVAVFILVIHGAIDYDRRRMSCHMSEICGIDINRFTLRDITAVTRFLHLQDAIANNKRRKLLSRARQPDNEDDRIYAAYRRILSDPFFLDVTNRSPPTLPLAGQCLTRKRTARDYLDDRTPVLKRARFDCHSTALRRIETKPSHIIHI